MCFLAEEVATGAVDLQPAVAGPALKANCSTPCLNIRLTPVQGNMDEYTATFLDGPLKEKEEIRSKISSMNQKKWDACQATAHRWQSPGTDFRAAKREDKVRATCHYLELSCARMLLAELGQDDQGDDPIAKVAALAAHYDAASDI